MIRTIAVLLIVVGVAGLVYGGITYTKKKHEVEFGPMQFEYTEKKTLHFPPAAGVIAVAGGTLLLLLNPRRKAIGPGQGPD